MIINITPPKTYSQAKLYYKTKKYMKGEYNHTKARNVFVGNNKNYYLYLLYRNIQIEVIDSSVKTMKEIEDYLEFLFVGQYIGVKVEGAKDVTLATKKVQCFYL